MDPHKAKATDLVVESLKLFVTIATLFLGALIAYSANIKSPELSWTFYVALGFFIACSILSIANIYSLINKLYRGEDDAIMNREAKLLNAFSVLTLMLGLISTSVYIKMNPAKSEDQIRIAEASTTITDDKIIVGKDVITSIQIRRSDSGKV